jgi:hypothetical protein
MFSELSSSPSPHLTAAQRAELRARISAVLLERHRLTHYECPRCRRFLPRTEFRRAVSPLCLTCLYLEAEGWGA